MRIISFIALLFAATAFLWLQQLSAPLYEGDVYYKKEVANPLSFQQIMTTDWSKEAQSPVNFGFTRAAVWYYLPLPVELTQSATPHVLEIDFPTINSLEFYLVNQQGAVVNHVVTGTDLRFASRAIWDDDWVFPIDPKLQGVAIYIRARASNSLQMPIRIYEAEEFYRQDIINLIGWGGFYGALMIMALYSFLNGLIIRQIIYLYYGIYVLASALTVSSLNGHGFAYLWPESPHINGFSLTLFPCLMICFGMAFSMEYLGISRARLRTRFLGYGFILAAGCTAAISVLLAADLSFWAAVQTVAFSVTLMVFGIAAVKRQHYLGWYFLIGWSGLLLGASMFALNVLGLLPFNSLTVHGKEVGAAFEIIMLSLGMAAIYNHEKEERFRINNAIDGMNQRLQKRLNLINSKSGALEIPQLDKHLQDIRNLDRRVHQEMGRLLVVAVQVIDKINRRPDYIAQGDCLRGLFNSRVTVFPFNTQREGLLGEITVLLFPLHNKFEAEPILERIEGWRYSLGDQYDLHFGYAISHLTEKFDVDYIDESLHNLEEAIQRRAVAYSIDDTLGFAPRQVA